MKLVFIRHTSVDVPRGVCYGRTDVPLASTFPAEAQAVKEALNTYTFDHAFVSPLSRCRALASYCGHADATADDRLLEMDFGAWEMQPFDAITDPVLQDWYRDYMNVRPTGGESSADQRARLADFLNELRTKNYGTVALFTHGGILIHALAMLGGLSYEDIFKAPPGYGSIVELDP